MHSQANGLRNLIRIHGGVVGGATVARGGGGEA